MRPGSELLVWYGDKYAKELGITTEDGSGVKSWGKGGGSLYVCGIAGLESEIKCLGCGESFAYQWSMDQHVRHSKKCYDANNYCPVCGTCFASTKALQRHLKGHIQDMEMKENQGSVANSAVASCEWAPASD